MNFSSVDVIWTLLGAALVYFMQAGFAMCEAGLTRAKNTGNILQKTLQHTAQYLPDGCSVFFVLLPVLLSVSPALYQIIPFSSILHSISFPRLSDLL